MGLTLSAPIATARGILVDPDGVRYSDADLLQYGNDALDQMVMLVPQEFMAVIFHSLTFWTAEQELPASSSVAFVEVVHDNSGGSFGNAVTQADMAALDAFNPGWRMDTTAAGPPKHWAPVVGSPRRFIVYPIPPLPAIQVAVRHVAKPGEYLAAADTGVNERFSDAIADYIVYRAESRDAEHVISARAQQFLDSFVKKVKG